MTSVNNYCNSLANYIENGFSAEEAILNVSNQLARDKSRIKINTVLKEFKYLYGHTAFHYEIYHSKDASFNDTEIKDLINEFLCYENKS